MADRVQSLLVEGQEHRAAVLLLLLPADDLPLPRSRIQEQQDLLQP